jgi:hypothetical protein
MIKSKWIIAFTIVIAIAGTVLQGCKKENGIDNNNVISTPYSLYFSDKEGAVYNTNDGKNYKTIFNSDGYSLRSLVVSGTNVLFIKDNIHLSTDNGNNFNVIRYFNNPMAEYQSMMLNATSHSRIYVATTQSYGVAYSEDNGKTWANDNNWDTAITNHYKPSPTTFAQTLSGDLYCMETYLDTARLYARIGGVANQWTKITTSGLPKAHKFYTLSNLKDILIASDTTGYMGVYYSINKGVTWYAYNGLPKGINILSTYAPFGNYLLVGTKGAGVYRLVDGAFVSANNGIQAQSSVYSFIEKSNTYKNKEVIQYIYAATNTGLYSSVDGGQNWTRMTLGDIRRVY